MKIFIIEKDFLAAQHYPIQIVSVLIANNLLTSYNVGLIQSRWIQRQNLRN